SSIEALPAILDAVGNDIEVHFDGGIRTGQQILKAIALGAKSTYIGRAFLYGLGAAGEQGVTDVLNILHKELDISMALCGERDILNVGKHNLVNPDVYK
ncbi:alpha-hydroxy-acid oxidizing protein, partial [Saccharospirillum sp. MSK14-1]|uniref:alpha-hydroxy acid oxidase n=1 Tax=Saccharospirillum sp. MSK14-1 TaxID=1897632 RepID=UPI0018EE86AE